MFGRVRRALEDALSRLESRTGSAEEDVDRLLASMREELIEAKTRIPEQEALAERYERERAVEKRKAEDCVRRASQAEKIGDAETVRVAERFARQHLERVAVLERKIEATEAEIEFGRREIRDMMAQLKDARARRDALAIQARRARGTERVRGSRPEAFDAFDRVADRTERASDLDDARRELDRELDPVARDATELRDLGRRDREADAEFMLDELKRRMGVKE